MKLKHPSLEPLLTMPVIRTLDTEEIKKNIPHRDPFLLVDEVRIIEEKKLMVGIKKVTGQEDFFRGHFPKKPIMPGVLITESISQAFGGAAASEIDKTGKGIPLFLSLDNVKFRGVVVPGDTLEMPIKVLRFGKICKIYAEAYVNGKLCTQACLSFILGENVNV